MEFVLTTDLSAPQEIAFNFDEIKAHLAENLARYTGLAVTKDDIQAAKKDRATLNKLLDAIETKRKDVKKACLAPYDDFERRIKELTGMIREPIDAIDAQIKSYEETARNEKYAAIEHFYSSNIGNLSGLLPIERILPPKWSNATEKLADITSGMIAQINIAKNNIDVIRAMNLPYEANIIDVYLRTLDMGAALAEKTRMEDQQKALDRQLAEKPEIPTEASVEKAAPEIPAPTIQEEFKTLRVVFYDTPKAFRDEMKALTQKYGIRYGGC